MSDLNGSLQSDLENEFKSLKILAFTNCCKCSCAGAYEYDDDFPEFRDLGIYFFRLHLNGMNYTEHVTRVCVHWDGTIEWLNNNWQQELDLIKRWCQIVIPDEEYTVKKPESETTTIIIEFKKPLVLDACSDTEEDE